MIKKTNSKVIANLTVLFSQKYRNKNFIVHLFHFLQSDIQQKRENLNIPNQWIIQPYVSIAISLLLLDIC